MTIVGIAYGAAVVLGAIIFTVSVWRATSTDDEPIEMPQLDDVA